MDWSWVQTFVATAELGSQNAAARQLGLTQPTVGRHLEALEQHLGTSLMIRSNRGVELTDAGRSLYEESADLASRFEVLSRSARAIDAEPEGPVRISVNEPIALHFLPEWYREIREGFPRVELEIVVDNRTANLSKRDADIAVRMYEPKQADLVAQFAGDSPLHLYAHKTYLKKHGRPCLKEGLEGHTVLGQDRDPDFHRLIADFNLKSSDFAFRSDSLSLLTEAAFKGVGVSALHVSVGDAHPQMERVLDELKLPALPLWVVTHESMRKNRTVWTLFRSLTAYLRQLTTP